MIDIVNSDNLPHKSGIYKIQNLQNNNIYIGQAKDIYIRYHSHHKYDYKNKKCSMYGSMLYKAIRKVSLSSFGIEVVELCDIDQLDERERYWINYFNSYKKGYNMTEGGQNLSENLFSDEAKWKRAKTREINQTFKGQNHPRAKLKNDQVIEIRQRYINGESVEDIFKDFCHLYNKDTFKRIVLGESYKYVGNIPPKEKIRYSNAKLYDFQIKEIRDRYKKEKTSFAKLAKDYGVSATAIGLIISNKTYKHINI